MISFLYFYIFHILKCERKLCKKRKKKSLNFSSIFIALAVVVALKYIDMFKKHVNIFGLRMGWNIRLKLKSHVDFGEVQMTHRAKMQIFFYMHNNFVVYVHQCTWYLLQINVVIIFIFYFFLYWTTWLEYNISNVLFKR